jgi:hypothetical protein
MVGPRAIRNVTDLSLEVGPFGQVAARVPTASELGL